jgi:hypothetical protein
MGAPRSQRDLTNYRRDCGAGSGPKPESFPERESVAQPERIAQPEPVAGSKYFAQPKSITEPGHFAKPKPVTEPGYFAEPKPVTEPGYFPKPEPVTKSAAKLRSDRHRKHDHCWRRRFLQPELAHHQCEHASDLDQCWQQSCTRA